MDHAPLPNDAAAEYHRLCEQAESELMARQWIKAFEIVEGAFALDPFHWRAIDILFAIRHGAAHANAAGALLSQAALRITADSEDAWGYALQFMALDLLKKSDEAVESGFDALDRAPDTPIFKYCLVVALASAGAFSEAETLALQLLDVAPDRFLPYLALADGGPPHQSNKKGNDYRKAVRLAPESNLACHRLATFAATPPDFLESTRLYSSLSERLPRDEEYRNCVKQLVEIKVWHAPAIRRLRWGAPFLGGVQAVLLTFFHRWGISFGWVCLVMASTAVMVALIVEWNRWWMMRKLPSPLVAVVRDRPLKGGWIQSQLIAFNLLGLAVFGIFLNGFWGILIGLGLVMAIGIYVMGLKAK